MCFIIYVPLCLIRKIEKLSVTHLFGDAMIIITLIVVFVYGGLAMGDRTPTGFDPKGVDFINASLFPDAIGFAVYAYEGIGVVLPI
jgi:amino acid permease